jgi:hypothetical protein
LLPSVESLVILSLFSTLVNTFLQSFFVLSNKCKRTGKQTRQLLKTHWLCRSKCRSSENGIGNHSKSAPVLWPLTVFTTSFSSPEAIGRSKTVEATLKTVWIAAIENGVTAFCRKEKRYRKFNR